MAQFRFSLDKVLRWRGVELRAEEARLQQLLQERSRLAAMVERVANERANLTQALIGLPGLAGNDLRAVAAYGIRLRQHVEKLLDAGKQLEQNLAAQQKKCAEAKMRVRLLEELRARKLQRWQYDQERQLEALAQESYLAGWNRES